MMAVNVEPSFGVIVKEHRRLRDLTQAELARRVGCAAITIRKIEADALRPSQQIAERLAMALGIPLDERASFVRLARVATLTDASPLPTPPVLREEIGQEDLSGRAIRGYALGERLGAGGYGVVYRAVQPLVEREVAVKIILPQYADQPDFIRRFEAEAQLVARLEHPHIVPLYDYWREPGVAYLVMRLLRGGSLAAMLQHGPLLLPVVGQLLEQIGTALHTAHRAGIIHRDLKPANVLLDEDNNVYLADFGIAKNLGNPNLADLTQPGLVIGSPAYFSPEQILAEPVKPQSDIYCLGIMLYELLTGRQPFAGPSPIFLIQQHLNEPLPPLAALCPDLPPALDPIIQRATAKDQAKRYPDVLSLLEDFRKAIVGNFSPLLPRTPAPLLDLTNPYKGLRAFTEADAADFFGRETLIQELLTRMGEVGDSASPSPRQELARFLAVVGPSGSGKSSVVRAGLVPSLREGGLPGSEKWFIVEMLPGSHPWEELEAALLRIAVNPPDSLVAQLREDERGLLRATRRVLPADPSIELVLIIDQFEELFTLVADEAARDDFLNSLVAAVLDPRSRLRLVITLRADFTDRPLRYVDFGELLRQRAEFVLPLNADEMEQAITGPAQRMGLSLEPGLVAAISRDVGDEPGALPLLQYALTELFEQSVGTDGHLPLLTKQAYQAIGGVLGALARRADEIYDGLDAAGQEAARQLFLRLVTLGEGAEDTRRRVLRAEVETLTADHRPPTPENDELLAVRGSRSSVISQVIDLFGRHRLLSFDRDPVTRGPTVEVAHEALLREWGQLHEWLDTSRNDIRMQRLLAAAAVEWREAHQDASFLLRGTRLDQFAGWAEGTSLALTPAERAYLEVSLADRQTRRSEEEARQQRELETAQKLAETEKRASRRLRWLAAGLAIFLLAAVGAAWFASNQRNIALHNAAESQNLALISGSQAALANGDTDQAIALALQAVTLDPHSTRAQVALSEAAYAPGTIRRFVGHTADIDQVVLSRDGLTALTASRDKTLILWDIQTGQIIRHFEGHSDWATSVAFSPDERTALSGSVDKTLILWDIQTGQILRRFKGHTDGIYAVAFSPDGLTALSSGLDRTLILWDIQTSQIIRRFEGHADVVNTVTFSPDGHKALSGSNDKTMILWDIQSGQLIRRFEGHTDFVYGVAFSPDGQTALSGSQDGNMILWDLKTGQIIHRFYGGVGGVGPVAFSPDGQTALSGNSDATLTLWDLATGQIFSRFHGHDLTVSRVAFSPNGQTALSSSYDGTIRLWDLENGQVIRRFTGLAAYGRVDYSPNGRTALVGTPDAAILLDLQTGQEIRRYASPQWVIGVTYSPDGRTALIGTGEFSDKPGDVILWDIETGGVIRRFVGHPAGVLGVDFSPDGRMAVSSGSGGVIILWDVVTGQEIRRFHGYEMNKTSVDFAVLNAVFSPDGRTILTPFGDGKLILWDVTTGQEIRQFVGHNDSIGKAMFSPDGQHAFTGAWDRTAIYWDVATGSILHRFADHSAAVFEAELTPDGRFGLGGSADNTTTLWDINTGEIIRRYTRSNAGVFSAAFNPADQGREAVIKFSDGRVEQWRIDTSLDELLAWTQANRYIPELTCAQRALYKLEPLCPEDPAPSTAEAAPASR